MSNTVESSRFGMSRLLQDVFSMQEGTAGALLQRLLSAARLHLGMEVAFISEFREGRRVFRYVDEAERIDLLKVGNGDPLDESYCQRVVDGRLPELIRDAQRVEEARKIPATEALGIGAHLSTPIRLKDGAVFGTFCAFSFHAEHTLNERDQALMRVFADIAAELIEQDIQRIREEESRRKHVSSLLGWNGFHMVWQPIVEIASGRITGVESLARFPGVDGKGPEEWFRDAASVGLTEQLESTAVDKGLQVLEQLKPGQYVACNTSVQALMDGDVIRRLERAPLERVVLEITEHDVIEDYERVLGALAPLREKGLRVAVDDAGAGYASLRHILRLRPDIIKLDISLTRDIDTDITRRSLALALVRFAGEIGSTLVAEGVETREELDTLAELGVDTAQGFFLCRPQAGEALRDVLGQSLC